MSSQENTNNLQKKIKEIIRQMVKETMMDSEIDEMTTTSAVGPYNTPFAFSGKDSESKKGKKLADLTGYTVVKEVTTNDWHFKAIMAIWDKGGSFTRKKIGTILLKDPQANRRDIEDALRTSDYDEVTDVTDRLRIEGINEEKFIPNVGNIDDFKLKSLLLKNPKVKQILGNDEYRFLSNDKTDVIMVSGRPFNSITTDGKLEFELDLKAGKLVKPLGKARPKIVSYYSNLK